MLLSWTILEAFLLEFSLFYRNFRYKNMFMISEKCYPGVFWYETSIFDIYFYLRHPLEDATVHILMKTGHFSSKNQVETNFFRLSLAEFHFKFKYVHGSGLGLSFSLAYSIEHPK